MICLPSYRYSGPMKPTTLLTSSGLKCVECKDDAELQSFFDGVKARGRELLSTRKESAA